MTKTTMPAADRMTLYFLKFCYQCTDNERCETDAKCRACAEVHPDALLDAEQEGQRCETRDYLQLQYDC